MTNIWEIGNYFLFYHCFHETMRSFGDMPIFVRKTMNLPNFAYTFLNKKSSSVYFLKIDTFVNADLRFYRKFQKFFGKITYEVRNWMNVTHVKNISTSKLPKNADSREVWGVLHPPPPLATSLLPLEIKNQRNYFN